MEAALDLSLERIGPPSISSAPPGFANVKLSCCEQ